MLKKIIVILVIGAFFFCGCATVPSHQALPAYSINGITYLPLANLCKQKGIGLDYDTFTRTAVLTGGAHKINLMAGETLVTVDGIPRRLRHPVDFYQGGLVVPRKFKEEIIDVLFKGQSVSLESRYTLPSIKKLVIDAGHGGFDPGTIGASGLREKSVNLDVANRLAKLLKNSGVEVIMTRTSDKFVSLEKRADIANKSGAELFVSIHSNANRVKGLSGFEAYYISPNASDTKRALYSAENLTLDLDGGHYDNLTLDLKATLWDMVYAHNRQESAELAQSICRTVNYDLDTKVLGVKGASFYVLKGVRMPAALIEIGFLSNKNEERLLKNTYYRQQMAEAIARGIRDYAKGYALAKGLE